MRHDSYTFGLAVAHLRSERPRVVYLALGETDDWAHDGRYDRVLEALTRTDRHLEELWKWLQSQNDYRGRTHILITTDHGRGRTPADWRSHGAKIDGAQETWMAFVSADDAATRRVAVGCWGGGNHEALHTNQGGAAGGGWGGLLGGAHPPRGVPGYRGGWLGD